MTQEITQVFGALDQRKPISDWFKFLTGNMSWTSVAKILAMRIHNAPFVV